MDLIMKFACDEDGTAALEYALVLTLIGIAVMAAVSAVGSALTGVFTLVAGKF
jgi:pilus assembly protein Flp/PilA